MMYFPTKSGAKGPQNPQNHRVVIVSTLATRSITLDLSWDDHGQQIVPKATWPRLPRIQ